MSSYELGILGAATDAERQILTATLARMVSEFGLMIGTDVLVHDGATVVGRDKHVAFAAAYFGGSGAPDLEVTDELRRSSAPIIPTLGPAGDFNTEIPLFLRETNGLRRHAADTELKELAAALLECVGLLRRQRRVFVSYRRIESRAAAVQLHDSLGARGFDVFLDTHDIRPGEPVQEVIWHRLCDSDVLVMLDTATYFESKWTRDELGRALAKDIHVLRMVWPGHQPSKLLDLAETVYLERESLLAADGPIVDTVIDQIVLNVEDVRSRSIAARYMSITGRFRAEVEKIGGVLEGIGAHRAISVRLVDDRRIWAYPVVGVPTAELLNDVADKAEHAKQSETPVLVYDHVGIGERWSAHLRWLDENLTVVRAVKIAEAAWKLAAWES